MKHPLTLAANVMALALVFTLFGWRAAHQNDDDPVSLKTVVRPLPPDLGRYVTDPLAAMQLGKTFFWDMQVGSDGIQTCASCHFHAGADNRIKNQLSPAGKSSTDLTFTVGGPNYTLTAADFPMPLSANDVVSSQGVFHAQFLGITEGDDVDVLAPLDDPAFNIGGIETRRVEPRNTPTTINAIFNFRNLWDGRANNVFTATSPFGPRDEAACLWIGDGGGMSCDPVALENASLASVATGPPMDFNEMASVDRAFPLIGRKLLSLTPLAKQEVHPQDHLLGPLAAPGTGLTASYRDLIEQAFAEDLWGDDSTVDGYTQIESNFSFYFGVAVMMYLTTQVSDDTPFDQFMEGNPAALTDRQKEGYELFTGKAKCVACHYGPEFTAAASRFYAEAERGGVVERAEMGDGNVGLFDEAFFYVGVRPVEEDLGVGRNDDFGNPLAFTTQYLDGLLGAPPFDPFTVDPCTFDEVVDANCAVHPDPTEEQPLALDGAVKTPGLRNIELTAPYFRNGSQATLMQVVEFFNRGGDFREEDGTYLGPHITPLGLTTEEMEALVDFMMALTDERVRRHQAPFDHPQLFVPNGHTGDQNTVVDNGDGQAVTDFIEVPAVGALGYTSLPSVLTSFHEQLGLDHFSPTNGQAHAFPTGVEILAGDFQTNASGGAEVLVGTYNFGVYRGLSDGPGRPFRWRPANTGLPQPLMVNDVLVTRSGAALIGTWGYEGIYRSLDGGASWTPANITSSGKDGFVMVYALTEATDGTLFASADGGRIFRSDDGGQVWDFVATLPAGPADTPWSLAPHPNDASTLYAGTFGFGVFVSTDAGATWRTVAGQGLGPDGKAFVFAMAFDPSAPNALWAATADGLFRSTNGGATWTDFSEGLVIGDVAHRDVRALTFAPDGTLFVALWGGGLFRLDDPEHDARWVYLGLEGEQLTTLALDPAHGMLLAGANGSGAHMVDAGHALSTGTDPVAASEVPRDFGLMQNYPNPFNPSTTLRFALPREGAVRLAVYDVLGRQVALLVDQTLTAGSHAVRFDASGLPSGTYLYRLETPGRVLNRSMVLAK